MEADSFETVAITWSQPEAAVMLAMFAFYGIPAFAVGRHHAAVQPTLVTMLQGIEVRVAWDAADEAREILTEVAERPAVVRPYLFGNATLHRTLIVMAFVCPVLTAMILDPAVAVLTSLPATLLLAAAPPSRVASTLATGRAFRPAAQDGAQDI